MVFENAGKTDNQLTLKITFLFLNGAVVCSLALTCAIPYKCGLINTFMANSFVGYYQNATQSKRIYYALKETV